MLPPRRRAPPPARRRGPPALASSLLHHLRLEADLALLRLEAEVDGLGALVGQDARGLLADQLLEALELHRPRLPRLLPGRQEAVVERAHGRLVGLPAADADLALPRRGGRARRGT